MGAALERFLIPSATPRDQPAPDGSVGWLEWREDLPMHLVIASTFEGRRTLIHAYAPQEKCVEHGFVAEWPDRIASWWDYPPIAELA